MAAFPTEKTRTEADGYRETVLQAPSSHEAVEAIIDRLSHVIRDLPLSDTARYRLQFVVHEALTNAVTHGNRVDPAKLVTATCRCGPDQVTVTIEDEGEGFDPGSVPDPTAEPNILRESGRGIFLMRSYADACRFENGGRRVVLVQRYDLPRDGPPDID